MFRVRSKPDIEAGDNSTYAVSSRNNSGQSETVILSGRKKKRNKNKLFIKYKGIGKKYE